MTFDDAELYEKHAGELIRFATALVGPSSAEDVLSAAVLRVFSSPSWARVTEKRAYLFRAVLSEAHQQHRSTQRRLRREAAAAREVPAAGASIRPEVLDALLRLTARQRAVVYLTYWLDHRPDEVATELEVSRRTVERELTTARRHMEVLLK